MAPRGFVLIEVAGGDGDVVADGPEMVLVLGVEGA